MRLGLGELFAALGGLRANFPQFSGPRSFSIPCLSLSKGTSRLAPVCRSWHILETTCRQSLWYSFCMEPAILPASWRIPFPDRAMPHVILGVRVALTAGGLM